MLSVHRWFIALCAALLAAACDGNSSSSSSSSSSGGVGIQNFAVTPASCGFGEVVLGATGICELVLSNVDGEHPVPPPVTVLSLGFTSATSPAFSLPAFTVPSDLAGGATRLVRLGFQPTALGVFTGTLHITTSDPVHAAWDIPLTGTGGTALTAVARVDTVNGVASAVPSPLVRPLDDVVLTGADSVAANPTRHVVAYRWQWTSKPVASTAFLTTPDAMTTGFAFNSSNVLRAGLDVAGTYVVGLTVTDDAGSSSTNPAQVTINVVPGPGVYVQMTWEDPTSDLDLHLVRGAGAPFSSEDCDRANCEAQDHTVGWATPLMELDDTNGFGPEAIVVEAPQAGDCTVGVHWYSGAAPSIVATVDVYSDGALLGRYTRELMPCDQYWEAARLTVGQGGQVTVQAVDAVHQAGQGVCH